MKKERQATKRLPSKKDRNKTAKHTQKTFIYDYVIETAGDFWAYFQ